MTRRFAHWWKIEWQLSFSFGRQNSICFLYFCHLVRCSGSHLSECRFAPWRRQGWTLSPWTWTCFSSRLEGFGVEISGISPVDLCQDPTAWLLQAVYRQKAPPLDVAAGAPGDYYCKKSSEHESRNNQSREDFNLWLVWTKGYRWSIIVSISRGRGLIPRFRQSYISAWWLRLWTTLMEPAWMLAWSLPFACTNCWSCSWIWWVWAIWVNQPLLSWSLSFLGACCCSCNFTKRPMKVNFDPSVVAELPGWCWPAGLRFEVRASDSALLWVLSLACTLQILQKM